MKILILDTDYATNQSVLASSTANNENIIISGDTYVYCDIVNMGVWNSVKTTISTDNYSEGILLPPKTLGKG